jgi:phosphatidylserine decarboxylase
VAVAAILVSSIHLHCLGAPGSTVRFLLQALPPCQEGAPRGAELGYFEHGSTIVLFAQRGWKLRPDLGDGDRVFMGQALLEPCPDYDQGDGT